MHHKQKADFLLLLTISILIVIGLAVLYSASTVESYQKFGNTSYYFIRQLISGGLVGIVLMLICMRVDYHFWQKASVVLVPISLILLVLVKIPHLGFSSGGATRWLHIGPVLFQPSELAKLTVIIFLSSWLSRRKDSINKDFSEILPPLIITGLFAGLILWQPDMGTMLVLVLTALVMFFVGGVSIKKIFTWIIGGGFISSILIWLEPYRIKRILTFFDPSHDPLGISYQINQAILAIGSGGWWGLGYGLSRQKYNYLPEAIGDSIFAVMAEELGFIRTSFVLALFAFLTIRGIYISLSSADLFGKILGVGIATWIGLQVCINVSSILGLLPLTGITLPLFSHGSSSLIVILAGLGILLNISKKTHTPKVYDRRVHA